MPVVDTEPKRTKKKGRGRSKAARRARCRKISQQQKARRKKKKRPGRILNWPDYERALQRRGSLEIWLADDLPDHWYHRQRGGRRGRSFTYSNMAIEFVLIMAARYGLPLRGAEGFVCSLFVMLGWNLRVPDHTTVSRRAAKLSIDLACGPPRGSVVVVDSTGLKVYGEGEWKVRQHGISKRRTWVKLHIAADPGSHLVRAVVTSDGHAHDGGQLPALLDQITGPVDEIIGDGAYDQSKVYTAAAERGAKLIVPPRAGARIWHHGNKQTAPHPRDEHIRRIRRVGRKKWKEETGYHRRSLSETQMFRYKQLIGDTLRHRTKENQQTEMRIGCKIINKLTHLGMPRRERLA